MGQVQKLQNELELAKKTNPGGVVTREDLENYVESEIGTLTYWFISNPPQTFKNKIRPRSRMGQA